MGAVTDRLPVLLVDGHHDSAVATALERCGFDVTSTSTAEDALYELGQHDVEAVVAVLPLPGLGGVGLCREIRARGAHPVLLVSSRHDHEWLAAMRAGADDHVTSRFDDRELRARLLALLRRYRGKLSPSQVIKVGKLTVRLGESGVTVDPAGSFTPIQVTMLGHLASQPGVVLAEAALRDRVRAVHGELPDDEVVDELDRLAPAVLFASGVRGAVQRLDGSGWRFNLPDE
jgi:two-component system, OmpR family, response regulator MtrA